MSPRFLIGVGVLTILLVAVTLWVLPSATDFSTSNPSWNGLQQARGQFAMRPVRSLDLLPVQPTGTALVVIPAVPLSPPDLDALKQYAQRGGVLILMDDFGFGNAVLSHLRVGARLSGQVLLDPLFNYRNRQFPRITDFSGGLAVAGDESVVFNHATVIADPDGMTVLARSSFVSFLDLNRNGRRDADEPHGPFAVAAAQKLGAGFLVLVSDSSVLLNSMLPLADNRKFVQDLFHLAGEGAQVYLDEAHLPRGPLDVAKDGLASVRGVLANPLVVLATVTVALAGPLALLWRSPRR